jgi:ribokinase
MTIWTLGSINADYTYAMPHFPTPGETLAATDMRRGLGGKGANQSVAAARAGADVQHLGAVGPDGGWLLERLADYGVSVGHIAHLPDIATGHALIFVTPDGENAIVLHPGANRAVTAPRATGWMRLLEPGDTLMLQNETDAGPEAAAAARARGAMVVYSAAPFDAQAVRAILPMTDLLILNAVEAAQLSQALGVAPEALPVAELLITKGAQGASFHNLRDGTGIDIPAPQVTPIDTTGAGDTFAGWFCAARDRGLQVENALREAAQAAAIQVTRHGTAIAIPTLAEVSRALGQPI